MGENNIGREKGLGKTILVIFLAIMDIALLVVIIMGIRDDKDRKIREANTYVVESQDAFDNKDKNTVAVDTGGKENGDGSAKAVSDEEQVDESKKAASDEEQDKETEDVVEEENTETVDVSSISTEEKPSLSDFMWYFDGVYWNGVPTDANAITESSLLQGSWKLFTWYYHNEGQDTYWIEFGNVSLDFNGDNVAVAVTPHALYPPAGEEPIDLTENDIEKYSGKWDGKGFSATGAGNFNVTEFYTLDDGKQYAIGTIDEPDATPTVIALVRP